MRPACLWIALLLLPLALPAEDAGTEGAAKHVLDGTYASAFNDRPERLRATFTPSGEPHLWKVTMDFRFNLRMRTWVGTAEGSFEAGRVAGVVKNETGNRVFTFVIERDKTRYKGTHYEVVGGRETKTGTLSLRG